jgi:hypothetical protein
MADELATMFAPAYRKGESLPIQMSLADLYSMAKIAQAGREKGMPAWGQEKLLDKMLLEGRADAGYNSYNRNNKRAVSLEGDAWKAATENNPLALNQRISGYPSAVLDKDETARRLNIPIERAWNGTGKVIATGRTGAQHAQRAAQMAGTQDDPRNAPVKDFLNRAAKDELTPKERLAIMAGNHQLWEVFENQDNEAPLRKYMRDNKVTFDDQTQRLLSSSSVLKTAYLRDMGIQSPKHPYAWEQPTGVPGTGSSTYNERREEANKALELKMIERDPEARAYIQDRLHGPVREPSVIDRFYDWLDTRRNPFK